MPITISHKGEIVSRHFFRRRARERAAAMNATSLGTGHRYIVRKAERGPFRWYCVKVQNTAGGYYGSTDLGDYKPTRPAA